MKLFSYSVKDQWEFLIIDINLKRKKKKTVSYKDQCYFI